MLRVIRHRGPDGSGIATLNDSAHGDLDSLNVRPCHIALGHNRLAIVGRGLQPIPNEDESIWLAHDGGVYNYAYLRERLTRAGHEFRTDMDSECLLHAWESSCVSEVDGDFAFVVLDRNTERLEAWRDVTGVRPLFIGKERDIVALASERKALAGLCDEVRRVEPGTRVIIEHDGVAEERVEDVLSLRINTHLSEEEAVSLLSRALKRAVRKRAYPTLAVFFSGGLDSSLVARLASEECDVVAITVGLEGSHDLRVAVEASKLLGIELSQVVIKSERDVINASVEVMNAIDECDPLKVSIGIPIYLAARRARELGIRVALVGQGADELFGGYAKYLRSSDPASDMARDLRMIHANNLERDDHCAMANNVEIRTPYLDREIVAIANSLPVEYKIRGGVRKWILRKVALALGLPKEIALREKKAVQYGSGVHKVLMRLARRTGMRLRDYLVRLAREHGLEVGEREAGGIAR